jgi:hypothetical protein
MKGELEQTKKIRFFSISLVNANVMSTPHFPQPQRLIGELIKSIESASPDFCWVQFLFKRVNLSSTLVALKNSIQTAASIIKTPKTSWISGTERDRRELYGDWYGRSSERMKRIDAVVNLPHILLAVQGMWVGAPGSLSTLPFKDCHDEHDRLDVFAYRNPWFLVELVGRRMVEDVSPYFMSYVRSRLEPPSFMITPDEIPYYIHLPIAKTSDFLASVGNRAPHSSVIGTGTVEGATMKSEARGARVLRLARVPDIQEPLDETDTERLTMLPSMEVRGFEVLFQEGATQILLSSRTGRDMKDYLGVMESVYGVLDVAEAPEKPDFLKQLPLVVGLLDQQSMR